eukprot:TRINITY_DN1383_c0_g1_i1.p1 TRINITY_DN1383_c0_g1~~TRINITY_DN1383_c0_g1_i1.p1  ORF type:complete len:428 (+),score=100.43 TRINITY_DN1383_c0_g1_i1:445-1728(+)
MFVMKHDYNKDSLNHRNIRNKVAEEILKHLQRVQPVEIDKPKVTPSFNPYKSTIAHPTVNTTSYNKQSDSFVKTVYFNDDIFKQNAEEVETKKKEDVLKENQKKLEKENLEKQRLKQNITDQIRRDAEEKKKDLEYKKMLSSSSSASQKQAVMEGGSIKWVEKEYANTSPSHISKSSSFHTIDSVNNNKEESDNDDDDSDNEEHKVKSNFIKRNIDYESNYDQLPPKESWTFSFLDTLLEKYEIDQIQKMMAHVGFTEDEMAQTQSTYLLRQLMNLQEMKEKAHEMRKQQQQPHQQHQQQLKHENNEKKTVFSGTGYTLSGSGSVSVSSPQDVDSSSSSDSSECELMKVDADKPQTSIRVRLLNGKLETIIANHSHTVKQLYSHVRKLSGNNNFQLINTAERPPKPVLDLEKTISEVNLLKGSITQK